jgi:hypothetical protein
MRSQRHSGIPVYQLVGKLSCTAIPVKYYLPLVHTDNDIQDIVIIFNFVILEEITQNKSRRFTGG